MLLWDKTSLSHALKISIENKIDVTGISIDSRTTKAGDLFIPIAGPNFDGHDFIEDALQKGAAAALSHTQEGTKIIKVDNTFKALQTLGQAARIRTAAKILAITGSVGKTSVTWALQHVLKPFGHIHGSRKSFNNEIGVPLSLSRMPAETDFGVFELGMNQKGELAKRTADVRPDLALITNVAGAHLEFFKNVSEIADAKAEIFNSLAADGTAILPRDSDYFDRLLASVGDKNVLTFGEHAQADVQIKSVDLAPTESQITAQVGTEEITYTLPLPGHHWAINSVAVLATVHALGLDVPTAAQEFSTFTLPEGRGQTHKIPYKNGIITLIDESYNANPTSMKAAIDVLGQQAGRTIAILGDMGELGKTSAARHADLKEMLDKNNIDIVLTYGTMMLHLDSGQHFSSLADLKSHLKSLIQPNDVLMVKGSKVMFYDSHLVQDLIKIFSEETTQKYAV